MLFLDRTRGQVPVQAMASMAIVENISAFFIEKWPKEQIPGNRLSTCEPPKGQQG